MEDPGWPDSSEELEAWRIVAAAESLASMRMLSLVLLWCLLCITGAILWWVL